MANWFDSNGPSYAEIDNYYRTVLGRPNGAADDPAAQDWVGNPNALAGISASPEAQAYRASQAGGQNTAPGILGPVIDSNPQPQQAPNLPGQNAQQYLNGLLASGMSPQEAIDNTNQTFKLGTGSSGQYYAPGSHGPGSGAVIGLAGYGGYFAQQPNGSWGWTPSAEQSSVNIGGGPGTPSVGTSLSGMAAGGGYTPVPSYQPPAAPAYQNYTAPTYTAPAPLAPATPYVLPTAAEAKATPGYEFTRDEAINAGTRNALARGSGINGGVFRDLEALGGNIADTYYGNRVNQGLAAASYNEGNRQNVYGLNANTGLNAFTANASAGQGAAGLNLQGQNQQFHNTWQPSWQSYLSDVGQNQFGANLGLAKDNLALSRDQFNLGAQNQFWNQGFQENQNAFNQYDRSQTSAFDQWLKLAQLGNVGNPYA